MVKFSSLLLASLILLSPLVFANKKANVWKQVSAANLQSLDENKYAVNAPSKNFKVVVFWASWCEFCHEELGDFNVFYDKMAGLETDFLAVSLDESLADARAFLKNRTYKFPVRWDVDKKLRKGLDIPKLPFVIIIGREGELVAAYSGYSKERFGLIKKRIYTLSRNEEGE